MIKVEYKLDDKSDSNTLIFISNNISKTYKDEMIRNVEIENLIGFETITLNLSKRYTYDVSAFNRFNSNNKINKEEIMKFIISVCKLGKLLNRYMLDIDDIYLDADHIYKLNEDYRFVYLPNYKRNAKAQLKEIFKLILDKIDYTDKDITTLCFAIYQMLDSQKGYNEILDYVVNYDVNTEIKAYKNDELDFIDYTDDVDEVDFEEDTLYNIDEKEKSRNKNLIKVVFYTSSFLVFAAGIIFLLYLNLREEVIGSFILAYSGLFYFINKLLFRKKKYENKNFQDTEIIDSENMIILRNKDYDIIVNKFPFYVGSNDDNDFVINKKYISRKHIKIYKEDNKIYLHDCESTNGTFLNNKKIIGDVSLYSGDIIRLAKYKFEVI